MIDIYGSSSAPVFRIDGSVVLFPDDCLVFTGTYGFGKSLFLKNGYALAGSKQPRHFKGSPSKNHLSLDYQIFNVKTPRPVTSGPAEFPRVESDKLSLPPFLYGNPWFRVTPSFFRLLSHLQPKPPKDGYHKKGETPRPAPSRTLTASSWLTSLAAELECAPLPPLSPMGLRRQPELCAP